MISRVVFDNSLQMFTCISTGGPATTVTWTRDSTTVTEGTTSVVVDTVTAEYKHTLIARHAYGGYTCTVTNNKPSSGLASIAIAGDRKSL